MSEPDLDANIEEAGDSAVEGAEPAPAQDAGAAVPARPGGMRLASHALTHTLVWLVAMSLFAAADSWSFLTGLGIAGLLCLVTGALAGLTTSTLIHEWFHYLGARFSGGSYDIPAARGLFVYDWNFASNTVRQFFIMSIAGSVGGAFSLFLLWQAVPADTLGRAAVHGGAWAGFAFAAYIEWPVLRRTRDSGDPLAELSKINQSVLTQSFLVSLVVGIFMTLVINS